MLAKSVLGPERGKFCPGIDAPGNIRIMEKPVSTPQLALRDKRRSTLAYLVFHLELITPDHEIWIPTTTDDFLERSNVTCLNHKLRFFMHQPESDGSALEVMSLIVDVSFWIDLVVNFVTGYRVEVSEIGVGKRNAIYDRSKVTWRYLKS
jgi:hypothetical protein